MVIGQEATSYETNTYLELKEQIMYKHEINIDLTRLNDD